MAKENIQQILEEAFNILGLSRKEADELLVKILGEVHYFAAKKINQSLTEEEKKEIRKILKETNYRTPLLPLLKKYKGEENVNQTIKETAIPIFRQYFQPFLRKLTPEKKEVLAQLVKEL